MDVEAERERLHGLLDSLVDDRFAVANTALTALPMSDAEPEGNADRAALTAAEEDPETIGNALAHYRQRQGWTHDDLAAFLGLTLQGLVALSAEKRPLVRSKQGIWSSGDEVYALAEAHGADNHRLFEAVEDRPLDT